MKKIVTIGGGTGTFVVLSGLKRRTGVDLSAIVSVADDGGSTGRLRDAYGYLPPGDVRQALVALSEEDTMLRKLFSHRFGKGELAGHNLGNLFLTALTDVTGSDARAIHEASVILNIHGRVIPVSEKPAVLCAEYHDGTCILGESAIEACREERGPIHRLYLHEPCSVSEDAVTALQSADLVVLGPGDLYTSTLANIVTEGMRDALKRAPGALVVVMNLFTTPESSARTMREYLDAMHAYTGRAPDYIVVNTDLPHTDALEHYRTKGQYPLIDDLGTDARVKRAPLISGTVHAQHTNDVVDRSLVRHDTERLADVLMSL